MNVLSTTARELVNASERKTGIPAPTVPPGIDMDSEYPGSNPLAMVPCIVVDGKDYYANPSYRRNAKGNWYVSEVVFHSDNRTTVTIDIFMAIEAWIANQDKTYCLYDRAAQICNMKPVPANLSSEHASELAEWNEGEEGTAENDTLTYGTDVETTNESN